MATVGKQVKKTSARLELWPPSRCIPYARNARVIPDSAVGKVAASIKEFGFKQPIVVDAEGVIVAGHTRLLAAERLGLDAVPVLVADDLTPAQVKAYRLADNRTGQEATWDYELLGIELEDLAGLDIDLSLTGFEPHEFSLFGPKTDPMVEWEGMPEFDQEDATSADHVIIHFATEEDATSFFKFVGHPRPSKRSMWWPFGRETIGLGLGQGLEVGALDEQWVAEEDPEGES